jgi:hypothetical protein
LDCGFSNELVFFPNVTISSNFLVSDTVTSSRIVVVGLDDETEHTSTDWNGTDKNDVKFEVHY